MARGIDQIETEIVITVQVDYFAQGAEPDVGIPNAYGEIQAVMFHGMNILHWLTPSQVDQLNVEIVEHMNAERDDYEREG
jgi:hypothetical protein